MHPDAAVCTCVCVTAFTDVVLDACVVSRSCWGHALTPNLPESHFHMWVCLCVCVCVCVCVFPFLPQMIASDLDVSITKTIAVDKCYYYS